MTLRYDTRSRVSTYTQSWVGGEPDFGVFESIATTTVGVGGTAYVEFSSIPATYKHLQVRWIFRSNRATFADFLKLTLNGDTATNYSWHYVRGDGSSASASASASADYFINRVGAGSSQAANVFGAGITDILDYADTNKYKTSRTIGGFDDNSTGEISLQSGNWRSTSAVSSLRLTVGSGTLLSQYSSFALYGIKG